MHVSEMCLILFKIFMRDISYMIILNTVQKLMSQNEPVL